MSHVTAADIRASLEKALSSSNPEMAFRAEVERFDNYVLEQTSLSEDYFELVCETLSRPAFFHVKGASNFLDEILPQDILSANQMDRLLTVIAETYPEYGSEELCWFAGDYIARRYPASIALDTIGRIAPNIKSAVQQNGLLLAMDILRWREGDQSEEFRAHRRQLNQAIARWRSK